MYNYPDLIFINRKAGLVMNQKEMLGKAVWLTADGFSEVALERSETSHFPILRSEIYLPNVKITKATLRVVGLGYFYCCLNGTRVSDDEYMPIYSDFEPRKDYPPQETLTGHRIYVPEYDVTELLCEGRNSIVIHCGGGWYTHGFRPQEIYGDSKAIYSLTVETEDGTLKFYSSPDNTKALADSFVKKYSFTKYEHQDISEFDFSVFDKDYDASDLPNAVPAPPLSEETVYDMIDCPVDKVAKVIKPTKLPEENGIAYYDVGENTTGYPIIRLTAPKGERVTLTFYEEMLPDGSTDDRFNHGQHFSVISDGKGREVRAEFGWYGFRYFTVEGDAEPVEIRVVHSDVKVTSTFECDNDTLNWIYDAFINTQLCNMHGGIPSDCPHIERRGYTGDGQLICRSAMLTLDARSFYRKWLRDIADCQDVLSGHVQYTAPYARCGGGPGGWGCAIVEVPYRYYKRYGEVSVLKEFYPRMLRYFDYLEAHSVNDLVISDKEGQWCLGDWATPESVILPAPYVNNYFYVKSLTKVIEIARLIKKDDDIPTFEDTIARRKKAIMDAYFNKWDGNFLGGRQGANAFAVDIGLGDERTYKNMVDYYRRTLCYDTGIFGTELVTRILFERGDGDLAVELLASGKELHTFDAMKQRGATTLWEYFPGSLRDRSHSHPMFGGVVACFFEYILGVGVEAGGEKVTVSPALKNMLHRVSGSVAIKNGSISVSIEKDAESRMAEVKISLPEQTEATFVYKDLTLPLICGENVVRVEI